MAKYTLVIDQGGHSTRAIVLNKKGLPIAYSSEPIHDPITNSAEHVEYAIDEVIASTQQLLQRLVPQLSPKKIAKIQAAALIAQRSSFVACDKMGNAITNMLSWQDTRNESWLKKQNFDIEHYQQLTGLRLNAHMGASKIRWLLDHDNKVQQHAKDNDLVFMPWGAYFLQKITQTEQPKKIKLITDPILAARTGLVEYGEQNWSKKLLSLYSIPENCLPKIVPSSYDYSVITLDESHIPIQLLGGDQNFIPCAYGIKTMQKNIYVNMGTGVFIQALGHTENSTQLLKTAIALEADENHSQKNSHDLSTIEGTVNTAATALEWWQSQLARPFSFAEIDQALNETKTAPVLLNTLSGTGSPYWLSPQSMMFLEDENTYNNEQKTVAVIESILFACKINIDIICQQNTALKEIVISGGLARSNALCQKLSELTQMTITRYDDSEASARGAAFYLQQKKKYKPENEPTVFTPEETPPFNQALYERFNLYKKAMEKLAAEQLTLHE